MFSVNSNHLIGVAVNLKSVELSNDPIKESYHNFSFKHFRQISDGWMEGEGEGETDRQIDR